MINTKKKNWSNRNSAGKENVKVLNKTLRSGKEKKKDIKEWKML